MKPEWKIAPEWANWLAMDSDGEWYWHEEKPLYSTNYWYSQGKKSEAYVVNMPKETLEKRPND